MRLVSFKKIPLHCYIIPSVCSSSRNHFDGKSAFSFISSIVWNHWAVWVHFSLKESLHIKGLFDDRDLSKIHNPPLFRLKEKSLRYRFTMQHWPGKWHRASDAISRNPVTTVQSLLDTFPIEPSPIDTDELDETCAAVRLTALTSISQLDGYPAITSLDRICFAGQKYTQFTLLGKTIDNSFPNSCQAMPSTIWEYWEVRNCFRNDYGLVLLNWREVIPTSQHKNILKSLHSAH